MIFERNDSLIYQNQSVKQPLDLALDRIKNGQVELSRTSDERVVSFDPYYISYEYLTSLQSADEPLDVNQFNDIQKFEFDEWLRDKLKTAVFSIYNKHAIFISGHFLYKPEGFMGWHTNINSRGLRIYFVYADEHQKSFFRYWDDENKQIITDYDNKGWNVRLFNVTRQRPFWHCVYSDTNRYSFGFRVIKSMK